MTLRLSKGQLLIYGLVVLTLGVIIGSVCLTYPFGRDQAFYAYAGKLFLEGKMSYKHVFDLKPPGSHFLFALVQAIAGESMLSMRFFDIIWQSLTAFLVLLITYKLSGKKILSLVAAFISLFLYYRQDYWHTLQADGLLNLPFALSVLLLIISNDKHSFLKVFFAGCLFAAAMVFKYTIVSFLPFVIIAMFFFSKELKSIRVKNIIVYFFGIIVIVLITLSLYYFTDSLAEFINVQFVQTPLYTSIAYETESNEFIIKHIIRLFTSSVYAPLICFSLILMVWSAFKRKIDFNLAILFSWIISSLFSLIVQWKFYHYHFLVIIPPISIGAVLFVSVFLNAIKENRKKIVLGIFGIILAGFIVYAAKPYKDNYATLFSFLSGKQTLREVYIKNGTTTDSVFMISKTFNAVDYVNQHTEHKDNIYVWGYDPLVYYLSGRECVSRFVYNMPLLWKGENKQFREEFMNELNKKAPKLIVIAQRDPVLTISGYDEDSKQALNRFPEFNDFIKSKYDFRATVNDYDFHELKNW